MSRMQNFKAQPAFALDSTLTVNSKSSIWKEGVAGSVFYYHVLLKRPKTVGQAIEMAAALEPKISASAVQAHLRWAYTREDGWLSVDGKTFATPAPKVAVVAKTPPAKVAKAKKAA